MSKAKAKKSVLVGLVESDGEEDQLLAELLSPDASKNPTAQRKKGRANAKTAPKSSHAPSKVTKSKPAPRRQSGRLNETTDTPKTTKGKRAVLADKTNIQAVDDQGIREAQDEDTEMDDTRADDLLSVPEKPAVTKAAKKAVPTNKVTKAAKISKTKRAPVKELPSVAQAKRGRPAKAGVARKETSPEDVIPETQVDEDEEEQQNIDVEKVIDETIHEDVEDASKLDEASTEEETVAQLRNQLSVLNKKYATLTGRYEDLRDVGVQQAEQNFDKLKKHSEETTKASRELIASLKADLAYQSSLAKDSKTLKQKLDAQKLEMAALQVQAAELKASLTEAQAQSKTLVAENKNIINEQKQLAAQNQSLVAENKTLSARLAANRSAAASVESVNTRVPGSAVKTNGGIRMVGTAEAAQLAQAAQLKEDIYSDLTGLIIQGVKREADEDVFNCLQTGRNGTLHFKLATANVKASESYDEAECSYVPQLDPSRDKVLMDILPDYLIDEITFPRPDAAKFYARVVRALTEKIN